MLPESKVRDFLREAGCRVTDGKTGAVGEGVCIRDNEQVEQETLAECDIVLGAVSDILHFSQESQKGFLKCLKYSQFADCLHKIVVMQ